MPLKFWNTGSYEDHQLSFNRKIKDIIALGNMLAFHSSTNIYTRVILHVNGTSSLLQFHKNNTSFEHG